MPGRPTHQYTIRVMKRGTRVHPDVVLHCTYKQAVMLARESAVRTRANEIVISRDGETVARMLVEFKLRWVEGIPP